MCTPPPSTDNKRETNDEITTCGPAQLLSPDGTALVIPMVDDIHILFSGPQ